MKLNEQLALLLFSNDNSTHNGVTYYYLPTEFADDFPNRGFGMKKTMKHKEITTKGRLKELADLIEKDILWETHWELEIDKMRFE